MVPCSPQRRRLCSSLIKEFFGEVVQKVSNVLTARGQQTLAELVRASSLPPSAVRSALLVLLQHNFVISQLVQPEAGLRAPQEPYYLYHADTAAIIQILRRPRILQHVKREYGSAGESELPVKIIEVLLMQGRLRLDQVVAAVAARLNRPDREFREDLHSRFISLVHSHYVERVPPADTPMRKAAPLGKSQGRKAAPKAGAQEKAVQQAEAVRQLAKDSYATERFKLPKELYTDSSSTPRQKPTKQTGRGKRKRDELDAEDQLPAEGHALPEALWRVNFEEINCRLRDEACAEHVRDAHGSKAGAVVAAALRFAAGQPGGGRLDIAMSCATSAADVASTLSQMRRSQPDLPTLPTAATANVLSDLAADERSGVVGSGVGASAGQHGAFIVDISALVQAMRQKHIEAIVRDRFPPIGMRVFRLLVDKKQLEQKQVADYAMVPIRDARELLYRMLRAGYLSLQDVPRTVDHAASRTFYTWRVDGAAVSKRVGEELLQAAANLRARLLHELTAHAEVLKRVEAGALLQREREEADGVRRMSVLLETRLLALDPLIALFHLY